ncbi:MAG: hypothetical protein JKX85_15890 [Phycisphaeraceae bacterium]|nr:hypothetical protein [Phycisphaeraceae bacterium]
MEKLKARFDTLHAERSEIMNRKRKTAALSQVDVLPPENWEENDKLPDSYQSLGAFGTSNIASSFTMAMFPVGTPWLSLKINEKLAQSFKLEEDGEEALEELRGDLSLDDQVIMRTLEETNLRSLANNVLEHEIVVGQSLFRGNAGSDKEPMSFEMWPLDSYVCRRTPAGKPLEVIIHELKDPLELTDAQLEVIGKTKDELDSLGQRDRMQHLYTRAVWNADGTLTETQEIEDKPLSQKSYQVPPYFLPSWRMSARGNYPRGLIEQNMGDLRSFDGLQKSILEATIAAAKVVFLVNPSGVTRKKQIVDAKNLAVLYGRPDDVHVIQVNKHADMSVALQTSKSIEDRLGRAMLLFLAARRDAERVTAKEIGETVRELEGVTGGSFSSQAVGWLQPLAKWVVWVLAKKKKTILAYLSDETIDGMMDIEILTGVAALTKESELQKDLSTMQILSQMPGMPEILKMANIARRILRHRGQDEADFVKSNDEIAEDKAADQAEAQQAQIQQAAAGKAIDVIGNAAQEEILTQ